jgi:Na+-driven multidrug efflux pump
VIAASALVGQNMGRKRPDISILYGKICQRIATAMSIILSCMFVFLRVPLVSLFSETPEVVNTASNIMLFIAVITFGQTSQVVYSGCLRGAGDMKFIAITSLISIGILRPSVSYILCYLTPLGVYGAWVGLGIDQFVRMLTAAWRFSSGKWTKIKI